MVVVAVVRNVIALLLVAELCFSSYNKLVLASNNNNNNNERELDGIWGGLPGQPKVEFSQFSGYVTVNQKNGRALFYWLTQATSSPHRKPLLLWLNGEANLLFLESPAGVGFSYTNTSSDLENSGDKRTAEDALVFLLRWMSRFPEYKYREFYIAGESYAGHYVPQLAKMIVDYNKEHSNSIINLKGFIVGNAVTDNYYDSIGTVTYWWSHAMISDKTYNSILHHCNFSSDTASNACDDVVYYAMNHEFGDIDQYNIYTPTCANYSSSSNNNNNKHYLRLKNSLLRRRFSGYDPCTEGYAEKYYNRKDVQRAMHANTTRIPYKWTACSDVLIKNWKDSENSVLPTYKYLIAAGLRIWVFSGDTDSVVPVTATRFSLSHLNLTTKTRWYPWYTGGQVGGWTEVYKGLTFATVRGAGHEVPLFQPKRAFVLFKSFLAGKELPKS